MADLKVCRICLCINVKVYNYNESNLKDYYEQILANKVNYKDGLPHYFCYVCAALLYKYNQFKEKCHMGQKALKDLLWIGSITLKAISQIDRQSKNLKSPIDIISVGKRVRTYNVKHKSLTKRNLCNSNNYLTQKELGAVNDANTIKGNDHTRNKNVKDDSNNRSEEKNTLSDYEDVTLFSDDDSFDSEEENNGVDKIIIKKEIEQEKNGADEILVKAKGFINQNKVVEENNGTVSEDDNFDSGQENNGVDEMLIKDEQLNNETIVVEEKIIQHTVIENKATTNDNHKSKKRKYNKGRNKDFVEKKRKKFENANTERKESRELDPKHWLKMTLNEEEAFTAFKARAQQPKYLSAPYKCKDCLRGFSTEDILKRHIKLRHCQSLGPIECRFCKMRFKQKCSLTSHAKQHYARYKCLRCDLTCPLAFSAFAHNEYHNGVMRKCGHCGQEFRHSSTYYTHLRTHRSAHVCSLCGASFVSKLGVQMHKKIKHVLTETSPEEEVNTFCQRCDIKFETRKAFEEHLLHSVLHAEDVPNPGNVATVQADIVPAPRKATSLVGPSRNRRKITPCNTCNKMFSSRESYMKHHKAEHKDEPLPFAMSKPVVKRVVCEICGASICVGNIAIHVNIHTREKLFNCATCDMQFNCKSSLNRHQRTHTGEKQYGCTLCDKRFKQNCSLKLHVRTAHLKEPYPYRRRRNKKIDDQQEISVLEDYYQRSEFFGKSDQASN